MLLLGDGNGRFSTHILKSIPDIQLISLDASAVMLSAAKKRRKKYGLAEDRLTTKMEDILLWDTNGENAMLW